MFGSNYLGQQYLGQAYPVRGIVFDNGTTSGYQALTNSYSWTHKVGLSNRGLLVNVSLFASGTVTGLSYNGTNLTFIRADSNGVYRNEMWYLEAPAVAGAHTILVTLSGTITSIGDATSYGNVDQTNMIEGNAGANGVATTPTLSVTTSAAYAWVVSGITSSDATVSPASSQTSRVNSSGALGGSGMADVGPINTPGSTPVNWASVGASTWVLSAVALKPSISVNNYVIGVTGSLSYSGAFTKKEIRSFTGSLSFTGVFKKLTNRILTGSLSFIGTFTKTHLRLSTLTASVSFTGSFLKKVLRSFTGSLSFTGIFNKRLIHTFIGQLTFIGSPFFRLIKLPFTGSVSFIGNFIKTTRHKLTASFTFIGNIINRQLIYLLISSFTFIGVMGRGFKVSLMGSVTFVGSVIGAIIKAFDKILNATLWRPRNGQGFVIPTGMLKVVTAAGLAIVNKAGLFVVENPTEVAPKYPVNWTKTGKTSTQWRLPNGHGFILPTGMLKIVTKAGLAIVNNIGLFIVENPTTAIPKYATSWTKNGKMPAQWRPDSGFGSISSTGSLSIVTKAGLQIVNATGLIIVQNPTFVKPKSATVWNPSGV